jgi:peptidoglycan/LPS O-acetylase OafA/YrhL
MESRPSSARPDAPARQLQSLTSLRGLAALWVVFYHYSAIYFPRLDIGDYSNLIAKGYLAVDLFFMLSGFVMTHVYYRAFSESITQNYRNFLVARVARLYPLHLLVLFLFLATALTSQLLVYMTRRPLRRRSKTGLRRIWTCRCRDPIAASRRA